MSIFLLPHLHAIGGDVYYFSEVIASPAFNGIADSTRCCQRALVRLGWQAMTKLEDDRTTSRDGNLKEKITTSTEVKSERHPVFPESESLHVCLRGHCKYCAASA